MHSFEDFSAGDVIPLGTYTVTREEIVAFATAYDPQPFHVDEEAARASSFGGLVASGWHTCAMTMRMYVDTLLRDSGSMGSPGVEEIRWRRPVRPGDVLTARLVVLETRPSGSTPGRGSVRTRFEVENQDGDTVLTMVAWGLFARREAASG